MITESQITTLVGRTGLFTMKEHLKFKVRVRVLNARHCFGREDCLIEPLDGEGEAWVSSNRVQISDYK